MVDYLTHYYLKEVGPFKSLSALPEAEAIRIMGTLYEDTPFGARFKDPDGYLQARRETENWVRAGFIAKGGAPRDAYPISMVLGDSQWMEDNEPEKGGGASVRIPLSIFSEGDLSFTYPDSMISFWLGRDKPAGVYQPDRHGIIFTLPEILALVDREGFPEEGWETRLPDDQAPYIEAQVWRHELLNAYRQPQKSIGLPAQYHPPDARE